MTRLIRFLPLALLPVLFLVACPSEGVDDCDSYIWEYTCTNGTCSCDDDVAECTDPEETTEDDPESCDNVCIECAPLSQ